MGSNLVILRNACIYGEILRPKLSQKATWFRFLLYLKLERWQSTIADVPPRPTVDYSGRWVPCVTLKLGQGHPYAIAFLDFIRSISALNIKCLCEDIVLRSLSAKVPPVTLTSVTLMMGESHAYANLCKFFKTTIFVANMETLPAAVLFLLHWQA